MTASAGGANRNGADGALAIEPAAPWRAALAWIAWCGLFVLLLTRLSISEWLMQPLRFHAPGAPPLAPSVPHPGPNATVCFAIAALVLAAMALVAAGKLARRHAVALVLIASIIALAALSAARSTDKFVAMIGLLDMSAALLAGFACGLLSHCARRKQLACGLLTGLLGAVCAKGFYQHYISIPATIGFYSRHRATIDAANGWRPGGLNERLFIARMKSQTVNGFLTLSDVFAEMLSPLVIGAFALGIGCLLQWKRAAGAIAPNAGGTITPAAPAAPTAPRGRRTATPSSGNRPTAANRDIPPALIYGIGLLLCAALGVAVAVFTKSKGGLLALLLGLMVMACAFGLREQIAKWRYRVFAGAVAAFAAIVLGAVAWGLIFHTLPTKSLAFRWQYWQASARMIARRPWLGVGLNNYGNYYTAYKNTNAPEDVKDPHSMLVRVATEAGVPAAVLLLGLVVWQFAQTVPMDMSVSLDLERRGTKRMALAVIGLLIAWFLLRTALAIGLGNVALIEISVIYLVAACVVGVFAVMGFAECGPDMRRFACLGLVVGAAAMLLYDQINLALVTGPVAMLFWMVLGSMQSAPADGPAISQTAHGNGKAGFAVNATATHAAAASMLLAAAVAGVCLAWPMMRGRLPCDPRPDTRFYERAMVHAKYRRALALTGHLLKYDPRSQTWLAQRAQLLMKMRKDPRAQIERLLKLNRASARLRMRFALDPRSMLSRARRVEMLRKALRLNHDLPRDELKRLTASQVQRIKAAIANLGARG